jgi:hypothetical protein
MMRVDMRNERYIRPDSVRRTSHWCYEAADRVLYLLYRGCSVDLRTKFSQVPVSQNDFPHLLSSLSFLSSTLPSRKNTYPSHRTLSLNAVIQGSHRVQHTLSIEYTEYNIHRVLLTLCTPSSQDPLSPASCQSLISWQTMLQTILCIAILTS